MINLREYPLTYICRVTGKEYPGKKIIAGMYSIYNHETGETEQLTVVNLRKRFKAAKTNHFVVTKTKYARPRIYSTTREAREFREYLNEKSQIAM